MAAMAKTQIAFLDPFHQNIYAAISHALPDDWLAAYAESREFTDQAAAVGDAEVVFALAAPIGPELLSAAPRLRLIQKLGAGVDRIDRDGCVRRGIAIARLAGGNAIPAAEHTVLLMLAVLRRLPLIDRKTRAGEWPKEEARGLHRQLHGKRIGLIGLGAIGRAVAERLAGFAVDIVYYDPAVAPADVERKFAVRALALAELLATSDIVSLHLPLLPETAGLIGEERIASMKPGAVLINCARGGLVDEAALARALVEGRLSAAGIDAFAEEPPVGSPLLELEQTVVTSHMAGATVDNFASMLARGFDNASRYLGGHGLPEQDAVFVPADGATRSVAPG